MVLLIVYIVSTLLISFLCSVMEAVLLTTPVTYLTMLDQQGVKAGTKFLKLKNNIDKPISSILALNTIANTFGASLVGKQAAVVFDDAGFGIISALFTVLILIFAEIIPKTIGTTYWKSLTGVACSIIRFMMIIMSPVVLIVGLISKFLFPSKDEATVSREEVTAMADIGEKEGVLDKEENKVIQNIMKLDSVKAFDVMTPRIVCATAQEQMTLKNFYKNDNYLHYSRIPVYSDSPEYITGYILLSDALEGLADDEFDTRLKELKRPISYFNDEMSIGDIWEQLLKNKEQIGLIIDEYGCFQGIITLEDIIETILGLEIIDENDAAIDMQQYARERWEKRLKRYHTSINLPKDDDDDDEKKEARADVQAKPEEAQK